MLRPFAQEGQAKGSYEKKVDMSGKEKELEKTDLYIERFEIF